MNTKPLPALLRSIQNIDFPHKLGICERVFGATISNYGVCWVRTAAGIEWKLDLANSSHQWIAYDVYQGPSFLNWAKRALPCDAVVIDAGANIGQWLLYVAQLIPDGKLLAFEPCSITATWLEECLSHNRHLPVDLINGVREYLKDRRIRAIYSELYRDDGRKVRDYLREAGYECHSILPNGRVEKITSFPDRMNGLFLPIGQ